MPRLAVSGVALVIAASSSGIGTAGVVGAAGSGLEQAAKAPRASDNRSGARLSGMELKLAFGGGVV